MSDIEFAGLEESAMLNRMAKVLADTVISRGMFQSWATDSWRPEVNLYETHSAFMVCADLAGMDENAIQISVADNQLIIRGHRICPMPSGKEKAVAVHLMEIDHGCFGRSIEMPANVDHSKISAHYDAGMLWITLPKAR
ncbi:MAG: Hsp20/alpha crystallin family protein [Phycisphaerae bacterium]